MKDGIIVTYDGKDYEYSTINNSGVWVSALDGSTASNEVSLALEEVASSSGVSPDVFGAKESIVVQNSNSRIVNNKIKIFE